MKLLIADDEFYVRVSIKEMMVEILLENDCIYEAENGIQMMDLVQSIQPDAVFLDIKMPKLDGLKAMEKLKQKYPFIQWVVISGYADFEYARQAVRLGAVDYLLKPVAPEQLKKIAGKIMENMQTLKQSKKDGLNRELSMYFNHVIDLEALPNDSLLHGYSFLPMVFFHSGQLDIQPEKQSLSCLLASLCERTGQYLEKDVLIYAKVLSENKICIIFCWEKENRQVTDQMINLHSELVKQVMEEVGWTGATFFGIMGKHCEIDILAEHISELDSNLVLGVLFRGGTLLSRQEFIKWSGSGNLTNLCRVVRRLQKDYANKDYYRFMAGSKEVLDWLAQHASLLTSAMKANLKSYLCFVLETGEIPAAQWKEVLRQGEINLLLPSDGEEKFDLVGQVIKYIECNYEKEIEVAAVAEKFHITPNYLSSLFHKATGRTFIRYLTEVRILNAKKLLNNSNVQVQEVAVAVGYENSKHFAKLFKKIVGCYPSQFRDGLKQ